MKFTDARKRLRLLLDGDQCLLPASVFDPISGRIAEDLGFECGLFGGSSASLTVLAAPDIALVTLTEVVEQVHRITRSCSIPVIVDADHGYGNALSVMRTVEELETVGAAGITIEDTLLPMPFGGYGEHARIVSIDETVGKLRAAVAARQDENLVLMGRTIVSSSASTEELVERVTAYEAAGVDAIFLVLTQTRDQLEQVAGKVKVPLVLGGYTAELDDPGYLAAHGVRLYFQAHDPLIAAVRAIYDTMEAQRKQARRHATPDAAGLMKNVVHADTYSRWAEAFLSSASPREKWR